MNTCTIKRLNYFFLCFVFSEILLQYIYFLKQSGLKERAVASYQAILEFNLFCPPPLESADMKTKMTAFEEFWDGCCSKLGAAGACGWRNHVGKYSQAKVKGEGMFKALNHDSLSYYLWKN